ncbi:MAG: hypothetical protein INQ03_07595 [Candidatus Heimdallarchaeota archaeon]|nr:hypothetical protein [Candidatus Heimdallarchaeota archaeon]
MMDISELQAKFSYLIESRTNTRAILPSLDQSPLRSVGESLLNKFAYQITNQAVVAEQRENLTDEIVENMVSSLVLAGMIGIDLESELTNLIALLESVSAEAS